MREGEDYSMSRMSEYDENYKWVVREVQKYKRESQAQRRKRKQREYRLAILRTIGQWIAVAVNLIILWKVIL